MTIAYRKTWHCTIGMAILWLAVSASISGAADFTAYVHERLLDKIAREVPVPKWQGSFGIPGVATLSWSSSLKDINFEITSEGIAFSSNLVTKVPWGDDELRFTQRVEGTAYLNFAASSNEIRFGTTHADVPIKVTIPYVGTFTVFTIRTPLAYAMTYPMTPRFTLPTGDVAVGVQIFQLQRHYESNRIRITGMTRIW